MNAFDACWRVHWCTYRDKKGACQKLRANSGCAQTSGELRYPGNSRHVVWDKQAVRKYHEKVDAFPEGLLLLVHVTSGQPARGSEIISLQHTNLTFHRDMFIEHGLVALVAL